MNMMDEIVNCLTFVITTCASFDSTTHINSTSLSSGIPSKIQYFPPSNVGYYRGLSVAHIESDKMTMIYTDWLHNVHFYLLLNNNQ